MPLYTTLADPQPGFFHQRRRGEVLQTSAPVSAQPYVISKSPAGYWKLNDTGSTAVDSSGNSRNGTYAGTVTHTQPALGGSSGTQFVASGSGYTTIAHNTAYNLSLSTGALWTLMLQGRWDLAGGGYPTWIGKGDVGLGNGWFLNLDVSAQKLGFGVNGLGTTNSVSSSTISIPQSTFRRIILVGSGRTVTMYVNGTQVGTGTLTTDHTVTSTAALLIARNDYNSTPGYHNVTAAEVAIIQGYAYNTADVAADWAETQSGVPGGTGSTGGSGNVGEVIPTSPSGPAAPTAGWATLLAEDFDGTIDWTAYDPQYRQGAVIRPGTPGYTGPTGLWGTNPNNTELQWYQQANVQASAGFADLRAQQQTIAAPDGKSYGYTSGFLSTFPAPFTWASIRTCVEVRMQTAAGTGLMSAVELLPADLSWPPEIDIAHSFGDNPGTVYTRVRYTSQTGVLSQQSTSTTVSTAATAKHTYTVDFQPGVSLTLYVDGVQQWQITDLAVLSALATRPLYLVVRLAVGGTSQVAGEPGSPDSTTVFPADLLVDYLRIWQDAAGTATGGTGGGTSTIVPYSPTGPSRTTGWDGSAGAPIVADSFAGPLDRNLWGYTTRPTWGSSTATDKVLGANDWEAEVYTGDGTNVTVSNGLTLTASPQSNTISYNGTTRTHTYLSGAINSCNRGGGQIPWTAAKGFTFNPSQATFVLEASIQVPDDWTNAWSAFWATFADGWPPELDMLEFFAGGSDAKQPTTTLHYTDTSTNQQVVGRGALSTVYSSRTFRYTCQIGPAGIFTWVDGAQILACTNATVLAKMLNYWYFLILNLAMVGSAGVTDSMLVNYVAVWRQGSGGVNSRASGPFSGFLGPAAGTVMPGGG